MFKEWFEVFFNPNKCEGYARKANLKDATINVLVASAIVGLITMILIIVFGSFIGLIFGGFSKELGFAAKSTGVLIGIGVLIYIIVSSLIGLFVGNAILLLFAKLFNGQGSYTLQTYLISLVCSAAILIGGIIGLIPIIGQVIATLAFLWSLYPLTIALKVTHRYSTGNALLTWLIPGIILLIIWLIVFFVFTGITSILPRMLLP